MPPLVLTDVAWFVNEYDLSGDANQHTMSFDQDAVDKTTFDGTGTRTYLPGLRSSSHSHAAYLDLDADAIFDALNTAGSAAMLVTLAPQGGDTEGNTALVYQSNRTSFSPFSGSVGGMAELSMAGQPTGLFTGGVLLGPKATVTSSSTTTGQNVGALNGGTAVANLHVFSGTASTLDVAIQSDDTSGFTSATSRGSFTQASAATSEQITITSAASDDWWRVSYTVGGGSWVFAVSFGII
jgi:hypothetical protein